MKKLTFLVIAVMLSFGALMAQDFFVDSIGYESGGVNGGLKAWGVAAGFKGDLVIPAAVINNGTTYNVTEVSNYFLRWHVNGTVLRSITLSEGIQFFTVGELVSTFDLPTNVDGAGDSIASIVLPSTITLKKFTNYTFRGHPLLKNFTIKLATPPTVDPRVFFNCNNYDTIKIHIPAGTKAAYVAAGWTTANLGGGDLPEYGTREILLVENVTTALSNVSASTINVRAISRNSFMVTGLNGKAEVNIYDLSGKRIAGFTRISNNEVLTNSSLKAGLFIVKVNNGANTSTAKLVFN
jgi:hypothetical protein